MFSWMGRVGLVFCMVGLVAACNADGDAPLTDDHQEPTSCTSDEDCDSGLCLADTQVCAATCEDTCQGDLVCTEGHCLPADYCDEGFGPGCAPTTCEPGCHADATCNLEATGGPSCACNPGFEGDGLDCTIVEDNPCLEDNGGCGDPELVQCDAIEDGEGGELAAECTTINPCLEDNGGCGDAAFFACTNTAVGEAECSAIDPCLTDNGGCGAAEFFQCDALEDAEGGHLVAECSVIDPCLSENGGCGVPEYFQCDAIEDIESGGLLAECSAIDPCLSENGGCGVPEYFQCDALEDAEGGHLVAECSAIDPCLTDNGGCGDPLLVQCDAIEDAEGGHLVAECTTINPCLTDNGGCGDPAFFTCTNTEVGVGECADMDFCANDNGGCGDPAFYACIPRAGELPLCRLALASCTFDYQPPLTHDVFVRSSFPDETFDLEFLALNPRDSSAQLDFEPYPHDMSSTHRSFLQYDLSSLSPGATIHNAALYLYVFGNVGDPGFLEIKVPTSTRDVGSFTWQNALYLSYENLGRTSVSGFTDGVILENIFERLSLAGASQRAIEQGALKLALISQTATTMFFSSEHPEEAYHPRLELEVQMCLEQSNAPRRDVSVSASQPDTVMSVPDYHVVDASEGDELYLRFDFWAVPDDARIVDVRLKLATDSVQGETSVMVDAVTESWDPDTLTYNTRPATSGVPLLSATLADGSQEVMTWESDAFFAHVLERYEAGETVDLRVSALQGSAVFGGRAASSTLQIPRLTIVYE
ncbi:DNRLRE domain-containing protein [Lujinxingia sediminis]|nr:DNRLRE domain-containing protein [Lujinxingia sediminis]